MATLNDDDEILHFNLFLYESCYNIVSLIVGPKAAFYVFTVVQC